MVDEKVVYMVMKEVCNFFTRRDDVTRYEGTVSIVDQEINFDVPSPYIIIRGSHRNDGLYYMETQRKIKPVVFQEGYAHPIDETFVGRVWFCYPTQDFLSLCERITSFEIHSIQSPITDVVSESFGQSSRTFVQGKNGLVTWKEQFGDSLRPYRNHMFEEVW